jgi:hypothetical protein
VTGNHLGRICGQASRPHGIVVQLHDLSRERVRILRVYKCDGRVAEIRFDRRNTGHNHRNAERGVFEQLDREHVARKCVGNQWDHGGRCTAQSREQVLERHDASAQLDHPVQPKLLDQHLNAVDIVAVSGDEQPQSGKLMSCESDRLHRRFQAMPPRDRPVIDEEQGIDLVIASRLSEHARIRRVHDHGELLCAVPMTDQGVAMRNVDRQPDVGERKAAALDPDQSPDQRM